MIAPPVPAAPVAALALNRGSVIAGCRKAVPPLQRVVPITLVALVLVVF
ncbi:hypothetical protein [Methanoculleus chikugoensis]|nr:hypothetical protein [Methanoculleus chikugoensis]